MRVPVYIVYAALVVAVQNEENQHFEVLEPVNIDADAERINYLFPKLAAKYRISNRWKGMVDPRLLVSAEMDSNGIENQREKPHRIRNKRYNYTPTLSVQAPIQALRNLFDRSNYQQKIYQNRRLINQLTSL